MRIKNWITCVQDRAKWEDVVGKPKPPTKGGSVPDEEEDIHICDWEFFCYLLNESRLHSAVPTGLCVSGQET
jgi:hypothetical protein